MLSLLKSAFLVVSVLAAPQNGKQPSASAAELAVQPECTSQQALRFEDCNRALLAMGGGIQGAIQFLDVNAATTTGQFGGCLMTATAVNGGTIKISKGRLERANNALRDLCGVAPGTVTSLSGASTGPLKIEVSAVNANPTTRNRKRPVKAKKQPSASAAELAVQPQCTSQQALRFEDCNRALLAMGGGIQGAIQFLDVNAATTTGQFGGCLMTATAVNGGTIKISKGRLERANNALRDLCGVAPGTVTSLSGASTGPLKIEVSAV